MSEALDVVVLLVTGAALGGAAVSVIWWWDTVGRGRAFRRWLGRHGDFDATVPPCAARLKEAAR